MWLKIKVWTKITIASLLAIYALIFFLKNTTQDITLWWWFNKTNNTSVFTLAFFAFVSGVIATILLRTTLTTAKQIREMRKRSISQKVQRDLAEMKIKAGLLQSRPAPAFAVEPNPDPDIVPETSAGSATPVDPLP